MLDSYMCEFLQRMYVKNNKLEPFETIMLHVAEFYKAISD